MTWKEKVLKRWEAKLDEDSFTLAYLTERDTSVPYIWEDSDINKSVHDMFYYVLSVVRDEVLPDGVIIIEPSYESTTGLLICDKSMKQILFHGIWKAWCFFFETEEDFEGWCDEIANTVRENSLMAHSRARFDAVVVGILDGVFDQAFVDSDGHLDVERAIRYLKYGLAPVRASDFTKGICRNCGKGAHFSYKQEHVGGVWLCLVCGSEYNGYMCESCGLAMNKSEEKRMPDDSVYCSDCIGEQSLIKEREASMDEVFEKES